MILMLMREIGQRLMNKKRIQLVKRVLREYPVSQTNYTALIAYVWREELRGRDFTPENIIKYCSSPTGIDRDRRREEVLQEFPRPESKYDAYVSYHDEFSNPVLFSEFVGRKE